VYIAAFWLIKLRMDGLMAIENTLSSAHQLYIHILTLLKHHITFPLFLFLSKQTFFLFPSSSFSLNCFFFLVFPVFNSLHNTVCYKVTNKFTSCFVLNETKQNMEQTGDKKLIGIGSVESNIHS